MELQYYVIFYEEFVGRLRFAPLEPRRPRHPSAPPQTSTMPYPCYSLAHAIAPWPTETEQDSHGCGSSRGLIIQSNLFCKCIEKIIKMKQRQVLIPCWFINYTSGQVLKAAEADNPGHNLLSWAAACSHLQ